MAYTVVQTTPALLSPPFWSELAEKTGADLVKVHCPTEDDLIANAQEADAVIALFEPYTSKVIGGLPRLRHISQIGIGYDQIDVDAATERGVLVTNIPDYCLEEVSDHAMTLLLASARKVTRLNAISKAGRWGEGRMILSPMSKMRGGTLGLVGFGRIPRTLLPKARGFGLNVIVHDPFVPEAVAREHGVELVSMERLLAESDYISVHAALTKENRHMFGLEQFKRMKPSAHFINTARGGLVDEGALYTALTEGYIAGAAIDVMESEPPDPQSPLLGLDNIIVTPHTAQASDTATEELMRRPMEEVVQVMAGRWPRGIVNPEVRERFVQRFGPMSG
ncbi:MAG: C-terminal binding protein [Chloroflexota bacterium]|nr:C-terminal binding protein [Chloroflexota bacterium]